MGKKHESFRADEALIFVVKNICRESNLTKTDFYELAIIDFLVKWNTNLEYDGVDFKEYAENIKLEKLRRIVSKERQQFLSKNLMMARINTDILKIITVQKRNKNPNVNKLIKNYLKIRKREATHYKDNEKLLEDITQLEKMSNQKIGEIKSHISDQLSDINYLKMITQQHENS